ncbi:uncharacterized protein LOC141595516 [Silene latifolia]|uniref:uncharacterized protein LOC141595516 n=1 Tax=Silene latifolia TaxID=37657 RepID=UPI003D781129
MYLVDVCIYQSRCSLTHVDLSDNKFSAGHENIGIGPQIGIQYLNVSHNSLGKSLPDSIGKLQSLKTLDFSYNESESTLPTSLAGASSLEVLKMRNNNLTGEIPTDYLKLSKLNELDLSDNLLAGKIPDGEPFSSFPVSSYSGNKGLCGKPLPSCKV